VLQRSRLFFVANRLTFLLVSVAEILHQIEALPSNERWQILEHTRHLLDAEIPESFSQGMAEIARGDVIELDEALKALDTAE